MYRIQFALSSALMCTLWKTGVCLTNFWQATELLTYMPFLGVFFQQFRNITPNYNIALVGNSNSIYEYWIYNICQKGCYSKYCLYY